ncbi:hypothetical protein HPB49_022724 [Dermacentor silvarum]|uniref:Uncharacterized protein n=1 Tax=Dermacentor silvarum TaxID=543639 RepID=A0ACB8CTJ3_DERSI|nr:hypothetical protein HPB49_022724 [Dermacentor silvarum]
MHRMHPKTYPTDKCKVCLRETADNTHILWDCLKLQEETRSTTIPPWLEAASEASYDQDQQLWAVHRKPTKTGVGATLLEKQQKQPSPGAFSNGELPTTPATTPTDKFEAQSSLDSAKTSDRKECEESASEVAENETSVVGEEEVIVRARNARAAGSRRARLGREEGARVSVGERPVRGGRPVGTPAVPFAGSYLMLEGEEDLPYPGFVPVALYYFHQDKPPRSWCLRLVTNPYPWLPDDCLLCRLLVRRRFLLASPSSSSHLSYLADVERAGSPPVRPLPQAPAPVAVLGDQ